MGRTVRGYSHGSGESVKAKKLKAVVHLGQGTEEVGIIVKNRLWNQLD